jgi:Flp pilus assembly secretin CpaC
MAVRGMAVRALLRQTCAAATLLVLSAGVAGAAPADGGIRVVMNQAKVLKLAEPADTIIIGNPQIADASVQDAKTVILTGRGFGVTNIVIMDADGKPLLDDQVIVSRNEDKTLRIYRQANVTTLSCTPYCESAYANPAEATSDAQAGSH